MKLKKCKGTGKALGYGCGKETDIRKYGLGIKCGCWSDWLINTEEGQKYIRKNTLRARKKVEKQYRKEQREKDLALKVEVKTKEYRKQLQVEINRLAKLIDHKFGTKCIDCNNPFGYQVDASHFHNVGGNENIRFNLHNIHSARAYCNQYLSGNKENYYLGMSDRYGKEYADYVKYEMPLEFKSINLLPNEIYEALRKVRKLIRQFDTLPLKNPIQARHYLNEQIGIYKTKFCNFIKTQNRNK